MRQASWNHPVANAALWRRQYHLGVLDTKKEQGVGWRVKGKAVLQDLCSTGNKKGPNSKWIEPELKNRIEPELKATILLRD